jgi:hypothetical protein
MGRVFRFGALGCAGLIALILILAAIGRGAGVATPTPAPAPGAPPPPVSVKGADAPKPPTGAPAAPPTKPAAGPNRGIVFGKPVVLGTGSANTVAVPATNTSQQVKTFTAQATYKNGDQILATAIGTVNDLLPGQMRVVTLLSQQPIPAQAESVRIDVDTMVRESATSPGAEAAAKITFGLPVIETTGGLTTIAVEATNDDTAEHTFIVQAAFMKGDEVIGLAAGAVNELAAGQTKTASLLAQGATTGHDDVLIAVDTVVE